MMNQDLPPELPETVTGAIECGDIGLVRDCLAPMYPAELAAVIQQLTPEQRVCVIDALGEDLVPEVLAELDHAVVEQVTRHMDAKRVAAALGGLDSDDVVDVIEELKGDLQQQVLQEMPATERVLIEDSLSYPDESAGRLMQRETVCVPVDWNVGTIIDHLRDQQDLPNDFYDIFVIDEKHRLVGSTPLSRVLRARRVVAVSDIMDSDLQPIPVSMDQEEVAFLFRRRDLTSTAVVDDGGRLVGVITIDDIVDVIDEEAGEDIMRLGGVSKESFYDAVIDTSRARFSWLALNLVAVFIAASVIAHFEYAIEGLVALAVLMPIVASMGGNAGTQSLTTTVRALAMRELTWSNTLRAVGKEIAVAGLNGCVFALFSGGMVWWWYGDPGLAGILALAMLLTLPVGSLVGTLAPLALLRLGVDPAVASGTFVAMAADVVGFFSFLGLAAWWLL